MSHFYRKKLNAQGKYINPPVHAKRNKVKKIKVRSTTDAPVMMYKFDRGPLQETSSERTIRIAKEAEARYYARQAEKEAKKTAKSAGQKRWAEVREMRRLQIANRPKRGAPVGMYKRSEEVRQKMRESAQKRWAGVLLTEEEKRLKRNEYQNARNKRLSAEAKAKSTSFVITITITDPNKS